VASFDLVYTDDHDAPEKQAFALSRWLATSLP